ncbi:MAG: LCP family protein, partial [Lachnospiraceae bacterium]|nr:LCP family protein [Lachnospiraceae bacterium]
LQEAVMSEEKTAPVKIRDIRSPEDFADEKWEEGIVRYDGKLYRYNIAVQNYLFMGIDNDDTAGPAQDGISGGQSDAMFLLCLNEDKKKISVIAINRNTMVPVDVYDRDGNFLVQMDLQICLQHGYGDGMKLSCMRSVEAVDRLLHNVPISGYIALNMGGIAAVNDAVGGIELTPIETVERDDIVIEKDVPVMLDGPKAYAYLRTRDVDKFASANDRLERQKQYITEYIKKLIADPSLGNSLYTAGKEYIVASIDIPKLVRSASDMTFDDGSLYTIEGETEFRDDYEQYRVDDDKLIRLILKVFYEEVSHPDDQPPS